MNDVGLSRRQSVVVVKRVLSDYITLSDKASRSRGYTNGFPSTLDPLSALWCEVAGKVKDQLGQVGGIGIDGSVGGGHNRHVGRDCAVVGVQR